LLVFCGTTISHGKVPPSTLVHIVIAHLHLLIVLNNLVFVKSLKHYTYKITNYSQIK